MFHWINNTYSFYGMDTWRVTPRLTLNLGLRYDLLPHVYNKENHAGNFVPADFNTANEQVPNAATGQMDPTGLGFQTINGTPFYMNGIELAGVNGFPKGLVANDNKTWEPRVGFAYDLFGNGKTVLRGGFGTFYERVQGNDVYGRKPRRPPSRPAWEPLPITIRIRAQRNTVWGFRTSLRLPWLPPFSTSAPLAGTRTSSARSIRSRLLT
jgi:outer membrane receptor protein involved in Fe transport